MKKIHHNMVEIIPAINVPTFHEVIRAIKKAAPFVSWVHIDVCDGTLTKETVTWHTPEPLSRFERNIEIHLMVAHPERVARAWAEAGAARILVHGDILRDIKNIRTFLSLEGYAGEIGVVIPLAMSPDMVFPYLHPKEENISPVHFVQFLAVVPGPQGQRFHEEIIPKIVSLRSREPKITIEVDGGVTPEVARRVKNAGANVLVSSSYIFAHEDIARAIHELQSA